MTVFLIIIGIFIGILIVCRLVVKLLIWRIEAVDRVSTISENEKKRKERETNMENYHREIDEEISPLVTEYQKSAFITDVMNEIRSHAEDNLIVSLDVFHDALTMYIKQIGDDGFVVKNDGNVISSSRNVKIKFQQIGYANIPSDTHLRAVTRVIHNKLGENYREDVWFVDIVASNIPIERIRLDYTGKINYKPTFLKPTL